LLEAVKLLGNDKPANFPLRVRWKRLEDDFLIEAPDQLWSEKFVEFGNDRPLECRERESGRTQKLLRANVAGADDIEPILVCALCENKDQS
jgi:hypothetical protein